MKKTNLLRKSQRISLILFFIVLYGLNSTEKKIDEIPVTLMGTVSIMQYYGSLNYGETPEIDSIEKYPVLTLCTPFAITIDGKKSISTFHPNHSN